MKKVLVLAVALTGLSASYVVAQEKPTYTMRIERSAWVQQQISTFEAQDYTKRRVAFQRAFAWGIGTYRGNRVEWFAYTNSDAYLQFNISARLADADLAKINKLKDDWWRSWETLSDRVVPGATWIGASNDWVHRACRDDFLRCDLKKAVLRYLKQLNGQLRGTLELTPAEYFDY